MCVCMCVYVCVRVCMYVRMYVCTYICMYFRQLPPTTMLDATCFIFSLHCIVIIITQNSFQFFQRQITETIFSNSIATKVILQILPLIYPTTLSIITIRMQSLCLPLLDVPFAEDSQAVVDTLKPKIYLINI